MKKVYLAGQPNEYDNNWKDDFKKLDGFDFYDPEIDSDQTSSETFFPEDLIAVHNSDILVANPSTKPSEATWIEIGYFMATHTEKPGDTCKNMIIIWKDEREPKWSIEFVRKAGFLVSTFEEARSKLQELV
ncbi:hypothetical protein C4561_01300 [candidate division WWE3 bacterium]|jgi:hypothetical protein|uniref:Nucleoside 2-deoxyribosyltransferase n=1 Tax=candidate division WWE3 bacterium TaxID=2053526 RepID=A0A3A4ZFF0_UNCKA|nr:MAG: hypothetical protein C4561_01300 [candidate division WWE3 bacterium]